MPIAHLIKIIIKLIGQPARALSYLASMSSVELMLAASRSFILILPPVGAVRRPVPFRFFARQSSSFSVSVAHRMMNAALTIVGTRLSPI